MLILYLLLNFTFSSSLYGVRWFLGDHFILSSPKRTHYILAFNSLSPLRAQVTLAINERQYSCSQQNITVSAFTTIQYICYITAKIQQSIAPYKILVDSAIIFEESLRTITREYSNPKMNTLIIGDWGELTSIGLNKSYVDIMNCLQKYLFNSAQEMQQINLFLFLGDLAYDFQSNKSINMLLYMQPITSIMPILVTPGNHDTYNSTFELFTKSFITPMWNDYFNYFSLSQINGVTYLGYNPQAQVLEQKSKVQGNIIAWFEKQIINRSQLQRTPLITYSHYPVYCSDPSDHHDSCTKNEGRLSKIKRYFGELYVSGHLHVYERMQCVQNVQRDDRPCTVYIVEGTGGNDYYVQTKEQYPSTAQSAALRYNTGFGLLRFQPNKTILYQHISSAQCQVVDQVVIYKVKEDAIPFIVYFIPGFVIILVFIYFQIQIKLFKKEQIK